MSEEFMSELLSYWDFPYPSNNTQLLGGRSTRSFFASKTLGGSLTYSLVLTLKAPVSHCLPSFCLTRLPQTPSSGNG